MRAMILAAGFGRRLHPLTDTVPKALIPLAKTPILEIILQRLHRYGFNQIAVNAHYHSDQIKIFLNDYQKKSAVQLYYSYEPVLLNTGGGIKKMLSFFDDDEPVLVHNVDILADVNYNHIIKFHTEAGAKATLVISKRPTDRPLAFSKKLKFLGRSNDFSTANKTDFGFCGIQVIQPSLFRYSDEDIFYSIDVFTQATQQGEKIIGYDITGSYWRDIGTTLDLESAEKDVQDGVFLIKQ